MLHKRLGIPSTSYYAVDVATDWRLLVLDTTELSTHSGYPEVCLPLVAGERSTVPHGLEKSLVV